VHEGLGELIRQARVELGWDQAELAQQLGSVRQQAVSSWERGMSRPRRSMIGRLAGLLGLAEAELLAAAGYEPTEQASLPASPPIRTRPETLPFHRLAPAAFESFSADLARYLFPGAKPFTNGSSGHRQDGADVIVPLPSGEKIFIQCKQVKEFGPAKIREAVMAMAPGAARNYLYLSRAASPEARKEVAKHPGWELRDAKDLSADVRYLRDQDAAFRLVDSYFGGSYTELFLGLADPGPWLRPDDFFRQEAGSRIYTHDWALAGRSEELGKLLEFLDDPAREVAVLFGRGGSGKSRLLLELARAAEHRVEPVQVRFLARNVAAGPRDFESLPAGGRLLTVIDDAHDREGLGEIVQGVSRARPGAKIILSLRPAGRGQLRAELRQAGLHPSEVSESSLGSLEPAAAIALATEALGSGARAGVAQLLAGVAPDCPLVIVVGGALISRGRLDPARVALGAAFRDEIMTVFRDAVTLADTGYDPQVRQELLRAVAALQPLPLDEPAFRSALSALAGKPFDQLTSQIRRMEEAEVLVRRGHSLRIAPDLLGDVILTDAAVHLPSGTSTGYTDRVLAHADGDCLLHLFVNFCRVEWQVSAGYSASVPLAASLWPVVRARFRAGDTETRLRLLQVLRNVAFFQPAETIDLVQEIMTSLVADTESPDDGAHADDQAVDQRIVRTLPQILENAAYAPEYLRPAADLLWTLAQHDERPPSQHPGHPIRVLQGLVEYNAAKSVHFHDLIIDAAADWLRDRGVGDWRYSPFEVLKPLLATTVTDFIPGGRQVVIRTYPVSATAVTRLRERVLDMAFDEARSPDCRRAADAMKTIGESVRYDDPASQNDQEQWTALFIKTIQRIGDLCADPALDPVVAVAARQALWWHAQYSLTGTKQAARDAWARLPQSARHDLALALHDGWGHLLPRGRDVAESERHRSQALRDTVDEAIRRWPDDEQLVEQRLAIDRRAFGDREGSPRPLVQTLAQTRPEAAALICQRVARNPANVLCEVLPAALSQLAADKPLEAAQQAAGLVATGEPEVVRSLAEAFGFARGNRTDLLEGEEELLQSLISSDDRQVRQLAVTAAIALARTNPALALELITTVRFADAPEVAANVAAAFGQYGGLSWTDLSAHQASQILDQLRECPSIDSYEIGVLLAEITQGQPELVLALLKDRASGWEDVGHSVSGYQPLPHIWHVQPDFTAHDRYPDYLRDVRDWIAEDPRSSARRVIGAEIFAVVAGSFDEQAQDIVIEALGSEDLSQVSAAAAILREVPPELARNPEFVSKALNAAVRHGTSHSDAVTGSLLTAAFNGHIRATTGQPGTEQTTNDGLNGILRQARQGSAEERFYRILLSWEEELARLDNQIGSPER
jgi:transcriptional regulator with XRE-family HTH domain